MLDIKTKLNELERAIVAALVLPQNRRWEVEENLQELAQLADTAGVEVVDELIQERKYIHPAHFLGSGKVEELKTMVEMHKVNTVIFDHDLTPAQARNLEKILEVKIIDRSALILDIFASHARTKEAKTQVELAQLQYFLPRLTRQWTHLSRQVGGIGTKGPGETQLETDRRLIRTRIETLRRELAKIDRQRQTRRQSREKVFRAALVGYTNVGKSTIMNLMTGSDVLVQNQLFATLDSTVRRVQLDTQHEILLSDTVGFIRKLPHHLVASFQSTLDEVFEADLLVHVVDGSHPNFRDHIETVNGVIKDLGAAEKPQLLVFNKIDLIDSGALPALKQDYPDAVFISAARSIRTNRLKEELTGFVLRSFRRYILTLPVQHAGLVSRLYQYAVLEEPHYEEDGVTVVFQLIPANLSKIEQLLPEGARIEEHPEQNGEPRIHNSEAEA